MPRVLVVDDEAPLRLLYRVNLEAEGFEVVDAADGLSGLAAAKEASPDVILLDVWMPALDGWQVAERLQNDAATRGIPIVFVTAQSRSRDRLRRPRARSRRLHRAAGQPARARAADPCLARTFKRGA